MPWSEIASELGIGTSAVKMRHSRAIERLREAVATLLESSDSE